MGVAVLDGSSLLSVVLGGLSLHRGCRRSCLVIPADARSQQLLSSIGGCRRSCLVILHRWVSPFLFGHPPSVGVAIPGVIFAEMTGANSGCLLCPVDYPCIGRCRHVWWVILHRWVSPFPVDYPCIGGCRRSCRVILHRWVSPFPSRCVAVLDGSSLLSVALGGSSSIEMCRHARCRSCGDDRSLQRLSSIDGCRYICIIFDLLFNVIDSTDLLYNLVAYWQNIFYNLTDLG